MAKKFDPQVMGQMLRQQQGGDRAQMMPSQEQLAARQQMQQQAAAQQQAQGQPMPQALPQFGKGGNVPTVQAGMQRMPQQAQPQSGKFGGLTQGQPMNRMGSPEAALQQQMAMQQARSGQAQGPGAGKGGKPPQPQV